MLIQGTSIKCIYTCITALFHFQHSVDSHIFESPYTGRKDLVVNTNWALIVSSTIMQVKSVYDCVLLKRWTGGMIPLMNRTDKLFLDFKATRQF